jgi:hypothetical protein
MTASTLELLGSVNRCQVAEMEKAVPEAVSGAEFFKRVRNVQASIINTYQVIALASLQTPDPSEAAAMWKEMSGLCENALRALRNIKATFSDCGTPELYDLTLDYKAEADKRYYQNLQDSECTKIPVPEGLFPKMS